MLIGKKNPQCNVGVTAQMGNVPWQSRPKEYDKVTLHSKPNARGLLGRENSGGQLPLLG